MQRAGDRRTRLPGDETRHEGHPAVEWPRLKLKGRDWGFIAVAVGVVATLIVLSMIGKDAKPMSAIPDHMRMTANTPRADCMVCHDPIRADAKAPLPPDHPLTWKKESVSCTVCHQAPSAASSRLGAAMSPRSAIRLE
jgi:hypothetical protein